MLFVVVAWADGGVEPQFRAGAAIFLWVVVILGLALGVFPRAPAPQPALAAGLCLGGLALLSGLSLAWGEDSGSTFNEVIRVLVYLGLFTVVVLASSSGGARPWLAGLALGIAAVAVLALIDRAQPGLFGAAEALREDLPASERRQSFPTGYWNGLGLVMGFGVLLFAWLGAEARTRRARAAATAAIPVAVLVLALTSSRGSFIETAVGAVVLVAFARSRTLVVSNLVIGAAAALVLVAVVVAVAPDLARRVVEGAEGQGAALLLVTALVAGATGALRYLADGRLASLRAPPWAGRAVVVAALAIALVALAAVNPIQAIEDFAKTPELGTNQGVGSHLVSTTGSGRVQYWEAALEAFGSEPLTGIGAGGFGAWWGIHHSFSQPSLYVHSLFIGALAELGIVGLALVVAFVAVVAAAGVRVAREGLHGSAAAIALALFAAGVLSTTIDWMWELPVAFGPVVVVAALLSGPALLTRPGRGRSRFGFGVAALIVGWIAVVAALLSLFGEGKIGDSREALERGDVAEALDDADTASTLMPWSAQPYLLKAAALEGDGDLDAAKDAVDDALDRDPGDWAIWAVAARIDAKLGDVDGSLDALAEANRRNPTVGEAPRSVFRRFGLEKDEIAAWQ